MCQQHILDWKQGYDGVCAIPGSGQYFDDGKRTLLLCTVGALEFSQSFYSIHDSAIKC